MADSWIKAEIDMQSLERQLKRVAKDYGETQAQAVKRWGVSTARRLAIKTQAFGKTGKPQKESMLRDASNVIWSFIGSARRSASGRTVYFTDNKGSNQQVSSSRFLSSASEVDEWIQTNRTRSNKRTRKLPLNQRKICSEKDLKRAINQRYKMYAGQAKEGWLDAGDDIARRQKGNRRDKIGAGFLKWTRKSKKNGKAEMRRRGFKTDGYLTNKIPYVSSDYVLRSTQIKKAIRDGLKNTVSWYRYSIRGLNKKRTR